MTLMGAMLMAAAVMLLWFVYPRRGQETRLMRLPGMWIVVPLTIILCFGSGGALIYTYLGK
jgi:hypothetical protein